MPSRPLSREQSWLLPPTLDELIPSDHPARFVAAFVDALDRAAWGELGIAPDGEARGAPGYGPRVLLGVWLYGFMTGVRSTRKLEVACRDRLPYLWLSGWQRPDHNTLWRFYLEHRQALRQLLKRTVRTAVRAGLVDLAVQAVDGTKLAGNAAKERTLDEAGLERLLARTEAAIEALEAQHTGGEEPAPPGLPPELEQAGALRARVQAALEQVRVEEGPEQVNLTDPDAVLVKGRQGYQAGYNGQAMVAGVPAAALDGQTGGLLITAAELLATASDQGQLLPMAALAEATTEAPLGVVLADGGYHAGPTLTACEALELTVLMPEAQDRARQGPYHKDRFVYDLATDSYRCPAGQTLRFGGLKADAGRAPARVYRSTPAVCRACPAFGQCTKNRRHGRTLEVSADEPALRRHRARMATPEAQRLYRQRKQLPEPVFGILKEQQGGRRLLLRGLEAVQAEWSLLATAFNLRTLWRAWRVRPVVARLSLAGVALV